MRLVLLAALVLAACSAHSPDPVTAPDATSDVAPADGPSVCIPGAQVACTCVGGATGAQVCATDGRSLGACACPDAGAPMDVPPVVDVPRDTGPEAVCAADVPRECPCPAGQYGLQPCLGAEGYGACHCTTLDAGAVDAGFDAGRDAGADVPRDAGPIDGGPVMYDIDEQHPEPRAIMLWGLVCRDRDCSGDHCDTIATPICYHDTQGVHFNIPGCGTPVGLIPPDTAGGLTILSGSANATTFNVARSGVYVAADRRRQNFHIQFAVPVSADTDGITGIPGRTVSPTLGDIWLYGCTVD